MNDEIKNLNREIELIKSRNEKVQGDKAWEQSKIRVSFICIITYGIVTITMYFIGVERYFANALIPVIGFYFSTLSLSFIKSKWIKGIKKT
ncbi:MAG: hypothetical protein EXS50_02665 [Candidatus Taylorbacteria bacterium]|nr:hypothetical protein [Candidatus Taylorbacteria bacterium]